jgi:hypothetical protein
MMDKNRGGWPEKTPKGEGKKILGKKSKKAIDVKA